MPRMLENEEALKFNRRATTLDREQLEYTLQSTQYSRRN